jgi:hypothetical protein
MAVVFRELLDGEHILASLVVNECDRCECGSEVDGDPKVRHIGGIVLLCGTGLDFVKSLLFGLRTGWRVAFFMTTLHIACVCLIKRRNVSYRVADVSSFVNYEARTLEKVSEHAQARKFVCAEVLGKILQSKVKVSGSVGCSSAYTIANKQHAN